MKSNRFWVSVMLLLGVSVGVVFLGPPMIEGIAYAMQKGKISALREQLAEMSKTDKLSPLFIAVSEAVKPSVVVVRVKQKVRMSSPSSRFGFPPGFEEEFHRRFGDKIPPRQFRGPLPKGAPLPKGVVPLPHRAPQPKKDRWFYRQGLGSGVIVDAENGYVLTNFHVVSGADKVEVILADGRSYTTEWIRGDKKTDLAVLKIIADGLIDAPLGDSDTVEVGQWVLAIGAPFGLPQTVTAGIISAKGRTTRQPGMYQNYLQTDASINRGNSGGPLVNTKGEVIGINTMILSRTGLNDGVGMSIPSNMARNVMEQLIDKGKVVRGFLGVGIQNIFDEGLTKNLKLPTSKGALVSSVLPDSAAAKAGLKLDDFIVSVDGKPISNLNELRNRIAGIVPGKTVSQGIYRNGEQKSIKVVLGTLSDTAQVASGKVVKGEAPGRKFGLFVQTLTAETAEQAGYPEDIKGVLIVDVDADSDAFENGVREKMVVTHVDGKPVTTAEAFYKAISSEQAKSGIRFRLMNPVGGVWIVFVTPK